MKIAVTKLREKSEGINALFRRYGHEALIMSTMVSADPTNPAPLATLAETASKGDLDILIFTSALGVDKLFERARPAKNVRIVSVGPKTAKKVGEYGCTSEVISDFSSEHFVKYLDDIRGKTIGIARADVPNPELVSSLESGGATVVEAAAYRLEPTGSGFDDVLTEADAVIFTSARSFEYSGFQRNNHKNMKVAAIGEKTAKAMRSHGIEPDFVGDGTLESCLAVLGGK
ncbi:MAG: uroporphyrinogen-III synthase [Candidatus Methanoperedens sp.]|nr:uroporphyrinogen-III synthase [Candidatus Methanoperedens sp.]